MAAGSATPEPPGPAGPPRRGLKRYAVGLALLGGAILLAHLALLWRMSDWLDAGLQASTAPARLQAAFVREIQPTVAAPTAAAPPVVPRSSRPRSGPADAAAPPAPPASTPPPAEAESKVEPEPKIELEQEVAALAAAASAPQTEPGDAMAAAATAASRESAAAPPFEWPIGTRLSYTLTGWVRGEVRGSAQVEWLREGARYQMHLDVRVGASFAPLMQRRMTSDGEIGPSGLMPRRYDERTQVAFGRARDATLSFEPGEQGTSTVTLATGGRVGAPAGVQDSASQFVQLTYLFATGASPLQVGHRIELPLALPRRVDRWIYEVQAEEDLHTPFGVVRAWHVKPHRESDASALSIEAWFAPTLRYLPVRIVIRQGNEDHLDLLVDRLPEEAEEEPRGGSSLR